MATLYENNQVGSTSRSSSASTRYQTFTPSSGHTIRMVRLIGSRKNETHLTEILATSGGAPTGSAIASGTMEARDVELWRYVGFGAGVALSAGVMYAIKIFTNVPPGNMSFLGSIANPYAGGTFNGTSFDIRFEEWDQSFPYPPILTSPANGATEVSITPTLQATYAHCESKAQARAQWQIDEGGGDFSSPVWDSGDDGVNLLSITVPSETLGSLTEYDWRARHKDNNGEWSEWSLTWSFTTLSTFIPKVVMF